MCFCSFVLLLNSCDDSSCLDKLTLLPVGHIDLSHKLRGMVGVLSLQSIIFPTPATSACTQVGCTPFSTAIISNHCYQSINQSIKCIGRLHTSIYLSIDLIPCSINFMFCMKKDLRPIEFIAKTSTLTINHFKLTLSCCYVVIINLMFYLSFNFGKISTKMFILGKGKKKVVILSSTLISISSSH